MPLPFLRLPGLAQSKVLLNLDLFDIFYFSLLSSKTKSIAKLSSPKVGVTWKLCASDNYHHIILENEEKERIEFVVSVYWTGLSPATTIHFDQQVLRVKRDGSFLRFDSDRMSMARRIRLFEKLNDHIVDIFKVKDYHLKGDIFSLKDFVSKYTKKLVKLTIQDVYLRLELPNVLEEFSVEELEIGKAQRYRRNQLEFRAPLKVRVLTCYALNWLTMEAFWNLDCEKLVLNTVCPLYSFLMPGEGLQFDQLNEIITRWIAGGWKNLKEFVMKYSFAQITYQMFIINGMRGDQINWNSFRVQREDGTTAIVTVMEDAFMMTIEE